MFLWQNGYGNALQIAVAGTNFCVSAKNAFSLTLRNIIRLYIWQHQ